MTANNSSSLAPAFALLALLAFPAFAWGWSAHQDITAAALEVLPEEHLYWKEEAGTSILRDRPRPGWKLLEEYSMLPDHGVSDYGSFYAPDYNLNRALPFPVSHLMPGAKLALRPHFERSLQALQTESAAEAFRRLGPLLHYVQDTGSPSHAKPIAEQPTHGLMESWDRSTSIDISGYQPRLLGDTPEAALQGLRERVNELVDFSVLRAEKLLPLVREHGKEGREHYLPLVLESAHETARATADLLHTMFTLGKIEDMPGHGLSGTVSFEPTVAYHDQYKGSRLILLNNDLYEEEMEAGGIRSAIPHSATHYGTFTDSEGNYTFRNLPAGTYRVFAYRVGGRSSVSEPVVLPAAENGTVDFRIDPVQPVGNIVYNPEGKVFDLDPDQPDRWRRERDAWEQYIHIPGTYSTFLAESSPEAKFRVGANLIDPGTTIRIRFTGYNTRSPWKEVSLKSTNQETFVEETFAFPWEQEQQGRPYLIRTADGLERLSRIVVEVITDGDFHDVVESVWVVPELGADEAP